MSDVSQPVIGFYWDLGSTNTYFALKLLPPLAASYGASIQFHPFNLGYVFQSNQYELMKEPKEKLNHRLVDLKRWATKHDLPFLRPTRFPIKTARALRGALAMREWDLEFSFIEAIFTEYWELDNSDIGEYSELGRIAETFGVDAKRFEAAAESQSVRQALIQSTDQARNQGVFGAPSMMLEGELYWGKDRFEFIEDHLARLTT